MYIAHYKSVNSKNEFYSQKRETLDFPTQIVHKKERYSLATTYIFRSIKQELNFKKRITALNIQYDINVDVS